MADKEAPKETPGAETNFGGKGEATDVNNNESTEQKVPNPTVTIELSEEEQVIDTKKFNIRRLEKKLEASKLSLKELEIKQEIHQLELKKRQALESLKQMEGESKTTCQVIGNTAKDDPLGTSKAKHQSPEVSSNIKVPESLKPKHEDCQEPTMPVYITCEEPDTDKDSCPVTKRIRRTSTSDDHAEVKCVLRCDECHCACTTKQSIVAHMKKVHHKTASTLPNWVKKLKYRPRQDPCRGCGATFSRRREHEKLCMKYLAWEREFGAPPPRRGRRHLDSSVVEQSKTNVNAKLEINTPSFGETKPGNNSTVMPKTGAPAQCNTVTSEKTMQGTTRQYTSEEEADPRGGDKYHARPLEGAPVESGVSLQDLINEEIKKLFGEIANQENPTSSVSQHSYNTQNGILASSYKSAEIQTQFEKNPVESCYQNDKNVQAGVHITHEHNNQAATFYEQADQTRHHESSLCAIADQDVYSNLNNSQSVVSTFKSAINYEHVHGHHAYTWQGAPVDVTEIQVNQLPDDFADVPETNFYSTVDDIDQYLPFEFDTCTNQDYLKTVGIAAKKFNPESEIHPEDNGTGIIDSIIDITVLTESESAVSKILVDLIPLVVK